MAGHPDSGGKKREVVTRKLAAWEKSVFLKGKGEKAVSMQIQGRQRYRFSDSYGGRSKAGGKTIRAESSLGSERTSGKNLCEISPAERKGSWAQRKGIAEDGGQF